MSFDLKLLGDKLKKYRAQFQVSLEELSKSTGIASDRLKAYEDAQSKPSGDEILILADYFKCDYKFFISNERIASFEQTELLFRRYGSEFSKADRWAIQGCLYLAECEVFLLQGLGQAARSDFTFSSQGTFYKQHGIDAAHRLRSFLGYSDNEVPLDIYSDFRRIDLRVYRRRLENSKVSGLCITHPVAGKCLLINYNEDIYRQRFTAAHEAAHAILDSEEEIIVSFTQWDSDDLSEIRANTFASHYLMPESFLKSIPSVSDWNTDKAIEWANKLKVSTHALSIALSQANLIDTITAKMIRSVKVPRKQKTDPELSESLSPKIRKRKEELLKLGLSNYYVNLCLEGYHNNLVSYARLAEMLLSDEADLTNLIKLFGLKVDYVF